MRTQNKTLPYVTNWLHPVMDTEISLGPHFLFNINSAKNFVKLSIKYFLFIKYIVLFAQKRVTPLILFCGSSDT